MAKLLKSAICSWPLPTSKRRPRLPSAQGLRSVLMGDSPSRNPSRRGSGMPGPKLPLEGDEAAAVLPADRCVCVGGGSRFLRRAVARRWQATWGSTPSRSGRRRNSTSMRRRLRHGSGKRRSSPSEIPLAGIR